MPSSRFSRSTPPQAESRISAFVGQSASAAAVRRLVKKVATSETSVLILGESGTGKEIVARELHLRSHRCDGPFVPVNCGAIPADLLESELFGHEKGAFTGALSARQGRFELAEGGTLFLDEIGDMPLPMQVKLLRVLQERCFERVGSAVTRHSNVRIVAATHQDLETRVEDGRFRADLYYRLAVFPIDIPPLRERRDDIPLLIEHFCDKLPESGLQPVHFDQAARRALQAYNWPGNVRELANLVERMAILHEDGGVGLAQLPARLLEGLPDGSLEALEVASVDSGGPVRSRLTDTATEASLGQVDDLKAYLADVEQSLLLQALQESDWVVAQAAKRLNLRRTTMVEKMRKLGISRAEAVSES
ncbi:MAG: sigma-54-dependent Fis family transcriptional regulator [Haliea sp.]|nr:sigma-54-dependent Fis family transcriptional regulator [Haliea sp.]